MSKVNTFRCDGCGKMREKDTNHWWAIGVSEVSMTLVSFAKCGDAAPYKHYCGEECAQAAIQRWMATGKLEPASATPLHVEPITKEVPKP